MRDLITKGVITIIYVKSGENLADPLTKALARDLVQSTTKFMGLKILSANDGNPTSD